MESGGFEEDKNNNCFWLNQMILFYNKKVYVYKNPFCNVVRHLGYNNNLSLSVAKTSTFSGRILSVHVCPERLDCSTFQAASCRAFAQY